MNKFEVLLNLAHCESNYPVSYILFYCTKIRKTHTCDWYIMYVPYAFTMTNYYQIDLPGSVKKLSSTKEKFAHHQLRSLLDEGKVSEDDPWEKMLLSGLCQLHAEAPGARRQLSVGLALDGDGRNTTKHLETPEGVFHFRGILL